MRIILCRFAVLQSTRDRDGAMQIWIIARLIICYGLGSGVWLKSAAVRKVEPDSFGMGFLILHTIYQLLCTITMCVCMYVWTGIKISWKYYSCILKIIGFFIFPLMQKLFLSFQNLQLLIVRMLSFKNNHIYFMLYISYSKFYSIEFSHDVINFISIIFIL